MRKIYSNNGHNKKLRKKTMGILPIITENFLHWKRNQTILGYL